VAATASTAACSRDDRPDVVVFLVDTLRADHVSAYGYERRTSPHLDAFAAEGALFEGAHTPAPWTVPAVASLLTGALPSAHGAGVWSEVRRPGRASWLHESMPTLPSRLREDGYRALGFSASPLGSIGLDRQFDEYTYTFAADADTLVTQALEALDRPREGPVLVYVHLMDVHGPIVVPQPFFGMFPVEGAGPRRDEHRRFAKPAPEFVAHRMAAYDGAIAYVDRAFGRFVDSLAASGRLDRTIVVVTADHGDEFLDHAGSGGVSCVEGIMGVGHGHTLFEELLRVPLIVRGPGVASGTRVATPVSLVDLAPTLLDLLGLEGLGGRHQGRSLVAALRGEALEARPVFAEQILCGRERRSILDVDGLKLILPARPDLEPPLVFDLARDPFERNDLVRTEGVGVVEALRNKLETAFLAAERRDPMEPVPLTGEIQQQLRALGYVER
jgi:arylsulfatase A-like enzyme